MFHHSTRIFTLVGNKHEGIEMFAEVPGLLSQSHNKTVNIDVAVRSRLKHLGNLRLSIECIYFVWYVIFHDSIQTDKKTKLLFFNTN